jgi:glutathione S-transferase
MPYKLTYFKVRGRAQALRYMCMDNDIALEEDVVSLDPTPTGQWASMKSKFVFGQLPVLHDGPFELAQSNAILRYVARAHNLYGSDDKEKAVIDMYNDTQEDIRLTYLRLIYQEYDAQKETYIKGIPAKLEPLEKVLAKNNGGTGFFVGSKASFVDYTIFDLLDNLLILSPHCLDTHAHLKAFHGRMAARDKIAKYRQTPAFKTLQINGNGKQ